MNDDLHNIDDLFRDGIEGHAEDVPPSVWEAVSHDLDKKQASYYKDKYNRLRRGAWLLLLLCFFGGGYIVYKSSGGSGKTTAKQEGTSSSSVAETNSSNEKKGKQPSVNNPSNNAEEDAPNNSDASVSNNPEKSIAQREEKTTGIDTASSSLPVNTTIAQTNTQQNKIDEAPGVAANQQTSKKASRNSSASFIRQRIKKTQNNNKDIASSKTKKQQTTASFNKADLPPSPVTQPVNNTVALATKDYKAPVFDIKAALSNNLSILPQTTASKSKALSAHGFSLTAFAAPNVSFDRLEDNDRLAGPGRNRQDARKHEQEGYSFSAGLLLTYQLTSKWGLQSGIGITSSSTAIAPETVYAKADNNGRTRYELHCSSGYAYINPKAGVQVPVGDSAKASGTVSKLTYINVPAAINYRISKGRFSLVPGVGAGINFLTSGKTKTDLSSRAGSESATTPITGLKPTYVDAQLGLGIEYNVSKKISISLRPNAKLALTPINKETPVQSYQNRLSVESGVRIKF